MDYLAFGGSFACVAEVSDRLKGVSLNNQPCQIRPTHIDVNSNEPLCYTFDVSVNRCGRTCDTFDGPYAQICVPDTVKNINVKVFNLISKVNEMQFLSSAWIVWK